MPLKDQNKRKLYHAKYMKEVWYPKNKKKHIGYVKRNKLRVAEFIDEYKRKRACMDCGFSGEKFPFVLDFDHIKGKPSKRFSIGSWSRSVLSIQAIEQEIRKCEIVCANCHRVRTFSKSKRRTTKSPRIP